MKTGFGVIGASAPVAVGVGFTAAGDERTLVPLIASTMVSLVGLVVVVVFRYLEHLELKEALARVSGKVSMDQVTAFRVAGRSEVISSQGRGRGADNRSLDRDGSIADD